MRLETERLLIEPLTHQDFDALATIDADSLVRRYIDNKTMTRQQVADYIEAMLRSYKENGYGRFAVKAKADGALIGLCGFIDEDYGVDFGYRYAQSSWGQGLATEAGVAVMDYGARKLRLPKLIGLVMPENKASANVLTKLGFTIEGPLTYMGTPAFRYIKNNKLLDI